MNREAIGRVKKAYGYQKKAIRSLFSESTNAHMEVIEQELKAMVREKVVSFVMEAGKEKTQTDSKTTSHKVNKIDIS